jgi:hypothetical protein
VIIDHRDRHIPSVLLAFGDDAGGDLLRARGIDRYAVVGALVLSGCTGGKGGKYGGDQNCLHHCLLP